MGNGKGNPEVEMGMTIAPFIKAPIVLKRSAGEEKRGEAGERPASCEDHHYFGRNAISGHRKDSKIREEDSKLDYRYSYDPKELNS